LPPAARAKEPKSYRDLQTASSTSSISHPDKPINPGGHTASADNLVHQSGIRDDRFNMVKFTRNNLVIFAIFPHQGYIQADRLCSGLGTYQECIRVEITLSDGLNLRIGKHYFDPDTIADALRRYFGYLDHVYNNHNFVSFSGRF
jgi:hypothetical protein